MSTVYSTSIIQGTTTVFTATVTTTVTAAVAKRDIDARTAGSIETPALVTGWPASRISAACSKVATGSATTTSIVTAVQPLTTSFATVTSYSTVQAVSTATSTAPAAPNLYTNAGFENGLSAWTYTSGSGNAGSVSNDVYHNGAASFAFQKKGVATEQYGGISQSFALKKGQKYTWSFWANHVDPNPNAYCYVYWQGILGEGWWTSGKVITIVGASGGWNRYSGDLTMDWDAKGMFVSVTYCYRGDTTNPGTFYMDELYIAEKA